MPFKSGECALSVGSQLRKRNLWPAPIAHDRQSWAAESFATLKELRLLALAGLAKWSVVASLEPSSMTTSIHRCSVASDLAERTEAQRHTVNALPLQAP